VRPGVGTGLVFAVFGVVSAGSGLGISAAGLPAGFLLGPMIVAVAFALAGTSLSVPRGVFQLAQVVIGLMIARSITTDLLGEIALEWPVFAGGVLSVIGVSFALGWWLAARQILPGPTAIWGTSPGAAVAMTLMSQAYGADERLVAFMQYLRVVLVVSSASLVAAWVGVPAQESSMFAHWFVALDVQALALTIGLGLACWLVARVWRFPAGALIVALVAGAVAQDIGGLTLTLPASIFALSFLIVGWGIGLRFTRETVRHAIKALPAVLASIVLLIVVCAGIAGLLVVFADVDPLTAFLATSPGGADTVGIIASTTHVDVAYVMAMQLARFLAVTLIGPPLARWLTYRAGFEPVVNAPRR
tara:strand:- start:291 stop:1370 length:1080 start_codon:yes stop_codon:yes gene_type:complete